jgi:hypothetical protein
MIVKEILGDLILNGFILTLKTILYLIFWVYIVVFGLIKLPLAIYKDLKVIYASSK